MNREELQTSLESKLPFDCSEHRVTAMQALLLGEDIYYTEPTLDNAAKRVLYQYEHKNRTKLKFAACNYAVYTVFLRFEDDSMRSVYVKDSELPWSTLGRV